MRIAEEHDLLSGLVTSLPQARRVLVFAPHPDDEVFGCGGALSLLREAGADITVHILTDGAQGGDNADGCLGTTRSHESRAALEVLGLLEPVFWSLPDRGLTYGEPVIDRIAGVIGDADADLVLLPSPAELHPDHQVVAFAGTEAMRRLGGERQVAFYEVSVPLSNPNLIVDITSVQQLKQQAMKCFGSQLAQQSYATQIAGLNAFRAFGQGEQVTSAEAFMTLTASDIGEKLPLLLEGLPAHRRKLGYAAFADDLPLVSVLVRSMDRDTLDEALDSLALQTYPHIEVLVINAKGQEHKAPNDSCGRFPLRFCDEGNPLDRSAAANVGLENAKGDYLLFLDDDDLCDPHHIASLMSKIEKDKSAVAAYAAVRRINQDGKELGLFAEEFDRTRLYIENYMPIHAVLFRRTVVDAGLRFDESLAVCEDWDFWLQVAEYGDFIFHNEVGATYRYNEKESSNVWSDPLSTREVMTVIYRKWLPKWTDETLWGVLDYARCKPVLTKSEQVLRKSGYTGTSMLELVAEATETRQEAYQAKQEAQVMTAHCEAVYDSLSWKCTAPIRALSQRIRSLVGRSEK